MLSERIPNSVYIDYNIPCCVNHDPYKTMAKTASRTHGTWERLTQKSAVRTFYCIHWWKSGVYRNCTTQHEHCTDNIIKTLYHIRNHDHVVLNYIITLATKTNKAMITSVLKKQQYVTNISRLSYIYKWHCVKYALFVYYRNVQDKFGITLYLQFLNTNIYIYPVSVHTYPKRVLKYKHMQKFPYCTFHLISPSGTFQCP